MRSFGAPTPDAPHPLPPPRDYVDQYSVEAGDTLNSIAMSYGITLEALMQANGLNEASILSIGDVLNIPPVETNPIPGSSFKLIPDSELVYGPASVAFDLNAFLQSKGGYLSNYVQDVDGTYLSGAQIITRAPCRSAAASNVNAAAFGSTARAWTRRASGWRR